MKNILSAVLCAAISLIAGAETTTMATGPLSLDLRTGVRESDGSTEAISYDSSWFGTDGATATVSVSRNGAAAETLHSGTGAGTVDWTPVRPGLYTLTHETLQGGKTVGETYTAQFLLPGIEYTVVFDANGGLGSMEPLLCSSRAPVTLPLCNFRRDGSDFMGWKNGAVSYADGAEAGVLSETDGATVTLTAQWMKHVEDGCYVVIDVSGGPTAERYPVTFLNQVPEGGWTDEYKTTKIVLRKIPHGTFTMGRRETDYPGSVNTNLHEVTLTKDFYAGIFAITREQWQKIMGTVPTTYGGAMRPVTSVAWTDVRCTQSKICERVGN